MEKLETNGNKTIKKLKERNNTEVNKYKGD
jgi:hypothetical protein